MYINNSFFDMNNQDINSLEKHMIDSIVINEHDRIKLEKFMNTIGKDYNLFKIILNNLDDGVYITDGNSKTIFINDEYEKLCGTKKEIFLGKNMDKIVSEGLINSSATSEVLKNNKKITMNQILNNKIEVLITSIPIYLDKNKIEFVVTTVRDITKLNDLKRDLTLNLENVIKLESIINGDSEIVSSSKMMIDVLNRAKKVAEYDSSILITGETGVGKDLIADYIHKNSFRKKEPFIEINCSALPVSLMESEMFGYEGGAFTGALKNGKKGIFELANKGSIFLDEIGEIPIELQAKLLKVLQNKQIRRIGGNDTLDVDVRIITATNRNLKEMVEKGEFREDLYYRLNVIPINIPPLRDRKEDIIPLLDLFLKKYNYINNEQKRFDSEVLDTLYLYGWPGNVRELKNVVERICVLSDKNEIKLSDLPKRLVSTKLITEDILLEDVSLDSMLRSFEKKIIEEMLLKYKTSKEVAKKLKISEPTLSRRRKEFQI